MPHSLCIEDVSVLCVLLQEKLGQMLNVKSSAVYFFREFPPSDFSKSTQYFSRKIFITFCCSDLGYYLASSLVMRLFSLLLSQSSFKPCFRESLISSFGSRRILHRIAHQLTPKIAFQTLAFLSKSVSLPLPQYLHEVASAYSANLLLYHQLSVDS